MNRAQLAALFRLRAKLAFRRFVRDRTQIVATVLASLFFVPVALGAGVVTAIGYFRLSPELAVELLGCVLGALWLLWVIAPVFGSALNDELAPERLLLYPLSSRTYIAAAVTGSVFDLPAYLALPAFGAVFARWAPGAGALVVLPAITLAYLHMVLSGQLVATVVGGFYQSRRFRDATAIVSSIIGLGAWFLSVSGGGGLWARFFNADALRAARPLEVLQWIPAGASARAIAHSADGSWGHACLWLGYSAGVLGIVVLVWHRSLMRLATGHGLIRRPTSTARPAARSRRAGAPGLRRAPAWISPESWELAVHELRLVWRIPARRMMMIQSFVMGAIVVAVTGDREGLLHSPSDVAGMLPVFAMFTMVFPDRNVLAWEGPGIATLLLAPIDRCRMLTAKSFALAVPSAAVILGVGGAFSVLQRSLYPAAGAVAGLCIVLIASGVLAFISIRLPMRLRQGEAHSWMRLRTQDGNRTTNLIRSLALVFAIGVLDVPATLPLVFSVLRHEPAIGIFWAPASLLYAVIIFRWATTLAGRLMLRRQSELFLVLARGDDSD